MHPLLNMPAQNVQVLKIRNVPEMYLQNPENLTTLLKMFIPLPLFTIKDGVVHLRCADNAERLQEAF